MKVERTVIVEALMKVLIDQYGYIHNATEKEGYILENKSRPDLGEHSLLLHCDFSSGKVTHLVGQVDGEPNRAEKHTKILELIDNVGLAIVNKDLN